MELGIQSWLAFFYVLWVCVPMIPAVLIYALFPKQQIGVKGPLGSLTVSATGAFAAYIIVFALAYPIVKNDENTVAGMVRAVWTVEADVKLVDENDQEVAPSWLKALSVELHPSSLEIADHVVTMQLPEVNGILPNIVLSVPNFGSAVIKPSEISAGKDEFHRSIKVDNVKIKRFPSVSGGLAKTASAN